MKGELIYERQFQAELYHHLKVQLYPELNSWIEPQMKMPSDNSTYIPDIVITDDKCILSIIELKWTPWDRVQYMHDMEKLVEFEKLAKGNQSFALGYIPYSTDWNKQIEKNILEYKLSTDLLCVYISFSHHDSDVFKLKNVVKKPEGLLHLYGYFTGRNKVFFKLNKE
jgi:Holliday junction resolvase